MKFAQAEALIAVMLAAVTAGTAAQDLSWPVHSKAPPPVSQAFGEFGDGSSTKYHSGLDFAVATGTEVFPVADGELVLVQRLSATADHGFGNSVILMHRVAGKPSFYSQYSHLSSIDDKLLDGCKPKRLDTDTTLTCDAGVAWTADQRIGKSGQSGFGELNYAKNGEHLHLEVKNFAALCASIPDEPGCGYSSVPPWTVGYSDPVNGLIGVTPFAHAFPVAVAASGVSVRFTPDAAAGKRAITTVSRDAANPLRAIAWSGGYPPCESQGWIQVRRADNPLCGGASAASACFADTLDKLVVPSTFRGLVPTAWICAKYLTPEKTSDARRAVTEGTLFSGGGVKVERVGASGVSVELSDRDGLFTVYEIPRLPNAATDFWNLIFLDMAYAAPPYASFADNQRELAAALMARFSAGCATDTDVKRQADCAVTRMANAWKVRIGGGRYDEGQRCVGWRDKPTAAPECRPY